MVRYPSKPPISIHRVVAFTSIALGSAMKPVDVLADRTAHRELSRPSLVGDDSVGTMTSCKSGDSEVRFVSDDDPGRVSKVS